MDLGKLIANTEEILFIYLLNKNPQKISIFIHLARGLIATKNAKIPAKVQLNNPGQFPFSILRSKSQSPKHSRGFLVRPDPLISHESNPVCENNRPIMVSNSELNGSGRFGFYNIICGNMAFGGRRNSVVEGNWVVWGLEEV